MPSADDFTTLPEYVEATRTQLRPGEPYYYSVPRPSGISLTDVTSFMPGQQWSEDDLPAILYCIKPPAGWANYKRDSLRNGPKKDAQGRVLLERWPQDGQAPRPLRDFPALPDQIGSREHPLFLLAWRRLEPACTWVDIIMRMQKAPGKIIKPNAVQMRINRLLVPFSIPYTWLGTKDFSNTSRTQLDILGRFSDRAKANNSARGFMPGLTYPELGEEHGVRVPLPTEEAKREACRYKPAATAANTANTRGQVSAPPRATPPRPLVTLTELREYEPPVERTIKVDDTDVSDLEEYEPAIDGRKSQKQLQAELRRRQARAVAGSSSAPTNERRLVRGKKRSFHEVDTEAAEHEPPIDRRKYQKQLKAEPQKRQTKAAAESSSTPTNERRLVPGKKRSFHQDYTETVESPRKVIIFSTMNKGDHSILPFDHPTRRVRQFRRDVPNGVEFVVEDVSFFPAPQAFRADSSAQHEDWNAETIASGEKSADDFALSSSGDEESRSRTRTSYNALDDEVTLE